jgi:hypothetical protein
VECLGAFFVGSRRTVLNKTTKWIGLSVVVAGVLSACGGGGGDAPAATPVTTYPLLTGYRALAASGHTESYSVSGTCSGIANFAASPSSAAVFEGASAFGSTSTLTVSFTGCTVASIAQTSQTFFDANYTLLGTSSTGAYGALLAPAVPFPTSVKVGDTAVYGSLAVYTDSTKTVTAGKVDLSYVVEPDTSTTAVVTLISKGYNTSNQLLITQQTKHRIAADGTLTPVSIDLQFSTVSNNHFVLTKT